MDKVLVLVLAASLYAIPMHDGKKSADVPEKLAAEPESPFKDISGIYECRGKDSKSPYHGVVTIQKRNTVYVVAWLVNGSSFAGIGVTRVEGRESVLAVAWSMSKSGQVLTGLNLYKMSRGEGGIAMAGRWATLPGDGEQHPESLTWLKAVDASKDEE